MELYKSKKYLSSYLDRLKELHLGRCQCTESLRGEEYEEWSCDLLERLTEKYQMFLKSLKSSRPADLLQAHDYNGLIQTFI